MAKPACPSCGYPLNQGESPCPECGTQLNWPQNTDYNNSHVFIDEGDNEAEGILSDTLNWVKKLVMIMSVVAGIISVIMGIGMGITADNFFFLIITILAGIVTIFIGFALAKLIWAVGMIFVNISNNVKIIKKSLASKD